MKRVFEACLMVGLLGASITAEPALAAVNGKNYGGMVCKKLSYSSGSAYYDTAGRVCNNSSSNPLDVICPIVQDELNTHHFHTLIDYVMYNLNGINGNQNDHPDERLMCNTFSRTRYGNGYYWSTWKVATGYGSQPTALSATTNRTQSNGFIGVRCQIPEKHAGNRSCISHICVDEVI